MAQRWRGTYSELASHEVIQIASEEVHRSSRTAANAGDVTHERGGSMVNKESKPLAMRQRAVARHVEVPAPGNTATTYPLNRSLVPASALNRLATGFVTALMSSPASLVNGNGAIADGPTQSQLRRRTVASRRNNTNNNRHVEVRWGYQRHPSLKVTDHLNPHQLVIAHRAIAALQ